MTLRYLLVDETGAPDSGIPAVGLVRGGRDRGEISILAEMAAKHRLKVVRDKGFTWDLFLIHLIPGHLTGSLSSTDPLSRPALRTVYHVNPNPNHLRPLRP